MKNGKIKALFALVLIFTVLTSSVFMVYAGSEPFLGEIQLFSFNFPPKGWARCNGQLLAINQNQALFALLGTQYGGNGQTTFALPDLNGATYPNVPAQPWGNSSPGNSYGGYYCIALQGVFPSQN